MMIKQDGTVLVHRPVMREPVDWQPSGAKTEFRVEENHMVIRSCHTRPSEKMKVTFGNLKLAVATSLCDTANLAIAGMEADVRGILGAPRVPDMVKKLLADYGLEWQEVEQSVVLPDDWQRTFKGFLEKRKIGF